MRKILLIIAGGLLLMSFNLIGAGGDLNSVTTQMNANILELKNRESTEIFKDETGVRRVLLGKGKDGFYGLKVSQPTFDVYEAGDDELIFNSSQNVFKIVASGTHVLSRPANTNVYAEDIEHGLDFIPTVIFNVEQTTTQPGYWYSGAQNVRINTTTGAIGEMPIVTVNDTVVTFSTIAPTDNGEYSSAKTFTFKYYLLQETAN